MEKYFSTIKNKISELLFGEPYPHTSMYTRPYEWVEQSVFFEEKMGKQVGSAYSDEFVGSSFSKKKAIVAFFCILIALCILLGKIIFLQFFEGDAYVLRSEKNRQRIIPIPAERGLIYDRNQIPLTDNIPNFSLAVTPQDLSRDPQERLALISRLASLTGEKEDVLKSILEEYGSYSYESLIILEDIEYETALQLQIAAGDLSGIHIVRGSKRLYREPGVADTSTSSLSLAHTIGYVGKLNRKELDEKYEEGYLPSDSIGKIGVEQFYEAALRGEYGRKRTEVDALGKYRSTVAETAPIPGKHLVLSIDIAMQQALEKSMRQHMEKAQKTRGAGIIVDPNNGEILALVSIPSFNNNAFSGGIDYETYTSYVNNPDAPLFHRAIGGMYPSGSTIKPAVAAIALQEGIINSATTFLSVGGIGVGQWFFPDWLAGGHGMTDVRKSLAQSVNTFYYYIGGGYKEFTGLGVETIVTYLRQFGFADTLHLDIAGEAAGFLPSKEWKEQTKKERWYVGDTYNLSIGQGDLLVTPLQIAMMTAMVANGGTLYEPHVVQKLIEPVSKTEEMIPSKIIRDDVINREHIETIRWGMRDCVTYGACARLSLLPFSAAGKTGTAQWNKQKEPHAWFTSFAPFENPEIVVTILVEEGVGGSTISAPIAYDFYAWWGEYRAR
ncbi:MAG: penicillin-binding protein 2 [Candidatus Magasanikbacteria bacterium]|nr:penicillin-binding protein 2 [Candidatus Magasanikbacteria bacterium]